jgi:hypothetical protein
LGRTEYDDNLSTSIVGGRLAFKASFFNNRTGGNWDWDSDVLGCIRLLLLKGSWVWEWLRFRVLVGDLLRDVCFFFDCPWLLISSLYPSVSYSMSFQYSYRDWSSQ